ncbi:hypothetical protein HJC23_008876 [Cyclotella cryptica]|uniref:Fucoxanthin chlorophyll a/c binding protein n=1 Tax=Cyclotella cryptica TaxID=29204 RepID=A0ABD3PCA9_9STRA
MKQHVTTLLLTISIASGFVPSLNHGGFSPIELSLNMAKGRRGGLDVGSSGAGKARPIGDNRDGEFNILVAIGFDLYSLAEVGPLIFKTTGTQ